jgi:two-component system chemotaxis response regulator CheB
MGLLSAWVLSALPSSELEPLLAGLRRAGYQVRTGPADLSALRELEFSGAGALILSDGVLKGGSVTQSSQAFFRERADLQDTVQWGVLVGGTISGDLAQRYARAGLLCLLSVPFEPGQVQAALAAQEVRRRDPLREIGDLVTILTGVQLDDSKRVLIEKRLRKRLIDLGLSKVEDYFGYFRRHREQEIPHLVSHLTTHTTHFFRDTTHYDHLADQVLPALLRARKPFKIWSAACSTGEEVYSIAIAIEETARALQIPNPQYEILGTDIDPKAVQVAQQGIYPADSVERIHPELRERYFSQGAGEISHLYKVRKGVWEKVRFRIFNLLNDTTPDGPFEAIFSRNVFIYFKSDEVSRIAKRMGQALSAEGRLFIGASETLDRKATGLKAVGGAVYAPVLTERSRAERPAASASSVKTTAPRETAGTFKRVLIVDDSKTVRTVLRSILTPEFGFTIVGEAENPLEAERILVTQEVDVLTLDIHMPGMDGIQYLRRIAGRKDHPPVVMLSSVSREEAIQVLQCLELGAADYLEKPSGQSLEVEAERIRATLAGVVSSSVRRKLFVSRGGTLSEGPPAEELGDIRYRRKEGFQDLIALGASTGGIEAIRAVFSRIPAETPPIVIVQHIPPLFSRLFANRLNDFAKVKVVEAEEGMLLEPNRAYIAPGGKHLGLRASGGGICTSLSDAPPIHGCRPAVDFLFHSIATFAHRPEFRVSAALLTGMGRDGAEGMLAMHRKGVATVAEHEDTCIVYGMPKAAMELGCVDHCVPLMSVAYHLFEPFQRLVKPSRKGLKAAA